MKKLILFSVLVSNFGLLAFLFAADPTPTPTPKPKGSKMLKLQTVPPATTAAPNKLQLASPAPTVSPKIKIPGATPVPTVPPKLKIPGPTPNPTLPPKIKIPGVTPAPTIPPKLKIPGATPVPTLPPKLKIPGITPTPTIPPKLKIPGVTPAPTLPPKLKIPGATPAPTLPPKLKIPGVTPTPTPKVLIPPKLKIPIPTPTPTPKILIPGPKATPTPAVTPAPPLVEGTPGPAVDVPAPAQLPPIIINIVPIFTAVQTSEIVYVPSSYAPIPHDAPPPPQETEVRISPTALRGWNGELAEERRAFDQTRIQLAPAVDGSRNWQFYWQTTIPNAQAARWEIARMPFYPGSPEFPPAGLVAYGDASIEAEIPVTENFFALDFDAFEKAGEPIPKRLYMRVVPVNDQGEPAGEPSNAVRIDRPLR